MATMLASALSLAAVQNSFKIERRAPRRRKRESARVVAGEMDNETGAINWYAVPASPY